MNIALGAEDHETEINVAGNAESSSLLEMLPRHPEALPQSKYVEKQACTVRRLDSIWDSHCSPADRAYLKIDAQGAERAVLRGATRSLRHVVGIQLELSLVPLYEGGPLLDEMLEQMTQLGFAPTGLEAGFTDPATGELLQVDGIFYRVPGRMRT